MTGLINLLPWRLSGRRRRLRFRVGAVVSVILLLISFFWGRGTLLSQNMVLLQKQGGELESQHHRLQEILLYHQGEQQRGVRQHQVGGSEKERQYQVSRWGDILFAIASKLPENSWLRSVSWQSNILTLEGSTPEVGDLERIETALKQLPDAFNVKAGPVSSQADQGLTYSFILAETGGQVVLP